MNEKIVTISREFGSGGRTVAKELAALLEVPYYDRELIEEVARQTGYAPKFIEEAGEYSPAGNLFSYAFVGRDTRGASSADDLWSAQRKVILALADKGPCVIVGRCADYILRDRADVLNVFIHAPMADRARRVVEKYGETGVAVEKRLLDKDKKRRVNYKYYTDRTWGAAENYHLTLDSGKFTPEGCVELLYRLVRGTGASVKNP